MIALAFVTSRKITNVKGRSAYLTDPNRQEYILCNSEMEVLWDMYVAHEQSNKKSERKNNEAREEIISLPNGWAEVPSRELYAMCKELAEEAIQKKTDYQFAVHWNKTRTNLHMHVLYSERTFTEKNEIKYYDRDIYHTEEGKVARNKKDRARDKTGNILPPVHKKGEEVFNLGFSIKDKKYKATWWHSEKQKRITEMITEMGYPQEGRKPYELTQHHQGKGSDAPFIAAKNVMFRGMNRALRVDERHGKDMNGEEIRENKRQFVRNVNLVITKENVKFDASGYISSISVDDDLIRDMVRFHNLFLEEERKLRTERDQRRRREREEQEKKLLRRKTMGMAPIPGIYIESTENGAVSTKNKAQNEPVTGEKERHRSVAPAEKPSIRKQLADTRRQREKDTGPPATYTPAERPTETWRPESHDEEKER